MNRLELALSGYRTLAPRFEYRFGKDGSDQAESWLQDEVCPAVEDLFRIPAFRHAASWSVVHLSPGANSQERALVEAIDAAIVAWANAALGCVAAYPTGECPLSEAEIADLTFVSERPWFDLVDPEERFTACTGLRCAGLGVTRWGRFWQRPETKNILGDHVARFMFERIEFWRDLVLLPASKLRWPESRPSRLDDRLFSAECAVENACRALRTAYPAGEQMRMHEAAATLAQAYLAYGARPDMAWAEIPVREIPLLAQALRSLFRVRVEGAAAAASGSVRRTECSSAHWQHCDPTLVRRVAGALGDAAAFHDVPNDPDELVSWHAGQTILVLVDRSPREVYWKGNAVADGTWDQKAKPWNLLWTAAQNVGNPVNSGMLVAPDGEAIRSRRSKLSQILLGPCPDLDRAVETVRGQGYRLALPPHEVVLLRDVGFGQLEVETTRSRCDRR